MPTVPKRAYLTDAAIRDLPAPTDRREHIIWDGPDPAIPGSEAFVVIGFGVRVMASGHKSFHFDCRLKDGSGIKRRVRIGRWPTTKADSARKKALELQQLVERGDDPSKARSDTKKAALTVNALADRFEREHMVIKKPDGIGIRLSTATNYRSLLRCHIRPELGKKRIGEVKPADIEQLHREISATGGRKKTGASYQANRVLCLISTMYNFAADKGLLPKGTNPCAEIKTNKERARRRYMSDEELEAVTAALDQHPDARRVAVIRLLMWTGARCDEVLGMKWQDLELHRKVRSDDGNVRELAVWDRKALDLKGDEDSGVPLADAPRRLLLRLHADQGEPTTGFVFPSPTSKKKGYLTGVSSMWAQITKAAKITKPLRLHDIRHSFASCLISEGVPLEVISPLMAHASLKTTMRYAHLKQGPQRNAVEKLARVYAGDSAEVIPFTKRG
jgi:integrase